MRLQSLTIPAIAALLGVVLGLSLRSSPSTPRSEQPRWASALRAEIREAMAARDRGAVQGRAPVRAEARDADSISRLATRIEGLVESIETLERRVSMLHSHARAETALERLPHGVLPKMDVVRRLMAMSREERHEVLSLRSVEDVHAMLGGPSKIDRTRDGSMRWYYSVMEGGAVMSKLILEFAGDRVGNVIASRL